VRREKWGKQDQGDLKDQWGHLVLKENLECLAEMGKEAYPVQLETKESLVSKVFLAFLDKRETEVIKEMLDLRELKDHEE
jgi:hypothetical protein